MLVYYHIGIFMPQPQQKYHYFLSFKIIYQEKMLMVVVLVVYSGNDGAIMVITSDLKVIET